jgi:hypothetical protein
VGKSAIKYRILRRMKYISDQEGIFERYLEEHEGWQEHIRNSREFIMECVRKNNAQSVVIMGSGWLLDVPLKELAAECKQVYLADIWHPNQVRATVRDYPNCNLIYTDLTGGAVTGIYSLVKTYRRTGRTVSLRSVSSGVPELPAGEDYMVSLNIINQLDIILMNYLKRFIKYPEEEVNYFRKKIQENHLKLLRPGHSCLICDKEEIVLDQKNQEVSTKIPIYADLPEAKKKKEWKWYFDRGGAFSQDYKTEFSIIAMEL